MLPRLLPDLDGIFKKARDFISIDLITAREYPAERFQPFSVNR